ncbi:MAG: ABC transporter ATP-binding protein [Ignavibacteriae bacterium]|nr:MAG: ABC transporter ATP-binding protein [Ignavibacteriota bacterium]
MDNKIIVKTSELVKEYKISKDKSLRVLKGINLVIYEGEIVSIIGASGAGKSTLLHLLGTLDKPSSGEVQYEGENVFKLSSDKLAKFRNSKIGFIFQFHHLLPEFTAIENVSLASMISGKSFKEVYNSAKNILTDVGLGDRLEHKPSELSGGEAQRVAIARALINSPRIIFADEPTGNLDTKNSDEVMNLIFDLRKKYNQTFVIVTHNERFSAMTDRTLKMVDGQIVNHH